MDVKQYTGELDKCKKYFVGMVLTVVKRSPAARLH